MARRVGLSNTHKIGKQSLYSTIYEFGFVTVFYFPTVYIDCHPPIPFEEIIQEGCVPMWFKHNTILRIFYFWFWQFTHAFLFNFTLPVQPRDRQKRVIAQG